jgi:Domain of unknown function (DUF4224)
MSFLTIDEMRVMTRLKTGSAIARWLDQQRITYRLGPDNYPVVLKAHVEDVFSGKGDAGKRSRAPNFDALRGIKEKSNGKK